MYNGQASLFNLRINEVKFNKLLPHVAMSIAIVLLVLFAFDVTNAFVLLGTGLGWSQWAIWSIICLSLVSLLGGITYFVRHFLLRWWR